MTHAPSLWLNYKDSFPGDIIQQDVCVPEGGATLDTYYCCLQWDAGTVGGGYCGIQDHPKGKAYIFSLWNPSKATESIKAVYASPGTDVHPFSGEGTGMSAFNVSLGWKPDNWYTLVTRVWPYNNNHTYFGFWVHDKSAQKWTHLVTMDFPYENTTFHTATGSFLEDWLGTGENTRRVYYGHGYKRQATGWYPYSIATFSVPAPKPGDKYGYCYDAGTLYDHFYVASGGTAKPTPGIGRNHTFYLYQPREPRDLPIDFTITSAKTSAVSWTVPVGATPQYKYVISVPGHPDVSDIQPEVRTHALAGCQPGDVVSVTLEDILGRTTTKTAKLVEGSLCGLVTSCSIV